MGICLMKQGRLKDAKDLLTSVEAGRSLGPKWGSDSHLKVGRGEGREVREGGRQDDMT